MVVSELRKMIDELPDETEVRVCYKCRLCHGSDNNQNIEAYVTWVGEDDFLTGCDPSKSDDWKAHVNRIQFHINSLDT